MDWSGVNYLWIIVMFLLDSHSDGTHSLQRIHWWSSDAMLALLQQKNEGQSKRFLHLNIKHLFIVTVNTERGPQLWVNHKWQRVIEEHTHTHTPNNTLRQTANILCSPAWPSQQCENTKFNTLQKCVQERTHEGSLFFIWNFFLLFYVLVWTKDHDIFYAQFRNYNSVIYSSLHKKDAMDWQP